jgi:tRNA G46 methylase TrmB
VPWPKDRHEKRRLFSTEFLQLRQPAGDDGQFQIVTDFEPFSNGSANRGAGSASKWNRNDFGPLPDKI